MAITSRITPEFQSVFELTNDVWGTSWHTGSHQFEVRQRYDQRPFVRHWRGSELAPIQYLPANWCVAR